MVHEPRIRRCDHCLITTFEAACWWCKGKTKIGGFPPLANYPTGVGLRLQDILPEGLNGTQNARVASDTPKTAPDPA